MKKVYMFLIFLGFAAFSTAAIFFVKNFMPELFDTPKYGMKPVQMEGAMSKYGVKPVNPDLSTPRYGVRPVTK